MASPLDINIVKNNDILIQFSIKDTFGAPMNITDFVIKWQVKKTFKTKALITKETGGLGIVITDRLCGVFVVSIEAEDTEDLAAGSYFHEAIATDTSGKSVTLTDLGLEVGAFVLREQYARQN